MSKFLARFKVPTAALCCAFLLGCETSQVNMNDAITDSTPIAENEGLVVARIVDARQRSLPFNHLTLTPENVNAASDIKYERAVSSPPRTNASTVFASAIPAGKYAVSSVRSYYANSQYWYDFGARAETTMGTFEVRPGHITDLGTLVVYPKVNDDTYNTIVFRLPENNLGEILSIHYPFYTFNPHHLLTWDEDGRADDRLNTYISAAQNPVVFNDNLTTDSGHTYFLSQFGVLVERNPDGEWNLDAVDTHFGLKTIAENSRGDTAVGSEEGLIYWRQSGGEWKEASLDEHLIVNHLYFTDDDRIYAIASSATDLEIYRADASQEILDWELFNSHNSVSGWLTNPIPAEQIKSFKKRSIISSNFYELNGEFILTHRTTRNAGDLASYNVKTEYFRYDPETWDVEPLEKKPEMVEVLAAGSATLGINDPGFWSFQQKSNYFRYQSSDDAWVKIPTSITCPSWGEEFSPSLEGICRKSTKPESSSKKSTKGFDFLSVPWFEEDGHGVAIVKFSIGNFWAAQADVEVRILETEDGGLSWNITDRELPKPYCSSIVGTVSDVLLLSCNGATGDFYESTDRGETWNHVREHQNL